MSANISGPAAYVPTPVLSGSIQTPVAAQAPSMALVSPPATPDTLGCCAPSGPVCLTAPPVMMAPVPYCGVPASAPWPPNPVQQDGIYIPPPSYQPVPFCPPPPLYTPVPPPPLYTPVNVCQPPPPCHEKPTYPPEPPPCHPKPPCVEQKFDPLEITRATLTGIGNFEKAAFNDARKHNAVLGVLEGGGALLAGGVGLALGTPPSLLADGVRDIAHALASKD